MECKQRGSQHSKINTTSFGNRSLRYSASVTWNECIKSINDFKDIKSINQLKNFMKKLYINSYKCK